MIFPQTRMWYASYDESYFLINGWSEMVRRKPQYVPISSATACLTYDILVGRVYDNTRMDTFWAFRQA